TGETHHQNVTKDPLQAFASLHVGFFVRPPNRTASSNTLKCRNSSRVSAHTFPIKNTSKTGSGANHPDSRLNEAFASKTNVRFTAFQTFAGNYWFVAFRSIQSPCFSKRTLFWQLSIGEDFLMKFAPAHIGWLHESIQGV
ncbi:MAG: hypothetical protein AAFP90_01780, partial [Planctomycetota bacterium]